MISRTRPGRVIVVLSGGDGCGKTTLATNVAAVLNADGARPVCLIDLDIAAGDIAKSLHLAPPATRDGHDHRTGTSDAMQITTLLTPYRRNFDCVLPRATPGCSERLRAPLVEVLLTALPARYDYVVVDTAPRFSALTLAALDTSHMHVLVTTPDRPAVRKLRRTLGALHLLSYDSELRRIVLNQSDTRIGMTPAQVAKNIKDPIAACVPSMWDVPISSNLGIPLAIAYPQHPVSLAIRSFVATHITGEPGILPQLAGDGEDSRQGRIARR